MNQIEVSELFLSVQGEGPLVGHPSLFLRLRRCNLQCPWCDTKYTWDKTNDGYNNFISYDPDQLLDVMVNMVEGRHISNLVVTGGEPLLWQRQLAPLLQEYANRVESSIEVETNGTIRPSLAMRKLCRFNVSPKLTSQGEQLYSPYVWRSFLESKAIFKFVVNLPEDRGRLRDYIARLADLSGDPMITRRVYLMPQCDRRESLYKNLPAVIEEAITLGCNVSTRLQIEGYDGQRGV